MAKPKTKLHVHTHICIRLKCFRVSLFKFYIFGNFSMGMGGTAPIWEDTIFDP